MTDATNVPPRIPASYYGTQRYAFVQGILLSLLRDCELTPEEDELVDAVAEESSYTPPMSNEHTVRVMGTPNEKFSLYFWILTEVGTFRTEVHEGELDSQGYREVFLKSLFKFTIMNMIPENCLPADE